MKVVKLTRQLVGSFLLHHRSTLSSYSVNSFLPYTVTSQINVVTRQRQLCCGFLLVSSQINVVKLQCYIVGSFLLHLRSKSSSYIVKYVGSSLLHHKWTSSIYSVKYTSDQSCKATASPRFFLVSSFLLHHTKIKQTFF